MCIFPRTKHFLNNINKYITGSKSCFNFRLQIFYERVVIFLYSVTITLGVVTNLLLMGAFLTNKVS